MRKLEDICPPGELQKTLLEARLDFKVWFTKILGKKYEWFHHDWVTAFHNYPRSAIIAPRGHGKTYCLGVGYILWYMFYHERKEIVIVAPNKKQSARILREIKNEMRDNELLQKLMPYDKNKAWNTEKLTTSTKCEVTCLAYSDGIRGYHVDRVLADEVGYFKNIDTFNMVIAPIVNKKNGHIMAISTPQSEGDLIMQLTKNEAYNSPHGYSKLYRAIMDVPEGGDISQGKPLWPEEYSMEKLLRIRGEQGNLKFQREYMCNPVATGTPVFPAIKIAIAKYPSYSLIDNHDGNFDREVYLGVDFGLSDSYEAGWTVITAIEKTPSGKLVVVDIDRSKGMHPSAIEGRVKFMRDKWAARQVWLDESTFGKNYLLKLQMEGVPVRGVTFTRENRNDLLMQLMKVFEAENIIIPFNMDHDRTNYLCKQLCAELAAISSDETKTGQPTFITTAMYDDMVMSLALASYAAVLNKPVLEYW